MQVLTSGIVQILELWIFTLLYLLGRYQSDRVTCAFILRVKEMSSRFDVYQPKFSNFCVRNAVCKQYLINCNRGIAKNYEVILSDDGVRVDIFVMTVAAVEGGWTSGLAVSHKH
jgi:hypothetical protein